MAFGAWRFYPANSANKAHAVESFTQVTLGSIESVVTAQGTLEPKDYVDVGAQVSGLIVKMHAEIGDKVKSGVLIAEIDPDVFETKVRSDKAALKKLAAQKAEQQALIQQAQQKYDRNSRLYKSKAISKEALEDTSTTLQVAKASLKALEAEIEASQSALEGNQTNLSYTKIYASMDGTVVDQSVQEGQTINANQTTPTIVQIANLDTMTVVAEVAEADVMKLKEGMSVYFTTLGSGERRWTGTVRQIQPTPEIINDVVLYNVLVDVENEDRTLMTGMTTQMFFVLASATDVPVVPLAALKKHIPEKDTELGMAYRVIVKEGDAPEPRIVIISTSDRTHAAVAEGLEVGDTVSTGARLASSKPAEKNQDSKRTGRRGGGARL